jgi:cysteinyl-tRNA synthetase
LKASQNALNNLQEKVQEIKQTKSDISSRENYKEKFFEFINDDLNTPKALALAWDLIKDKKVSNDRKYELLIDFDKVFGLGLDKIEKEIIPEEIIKLAKEREKARKEKNWKRADEIRGETGAMGYDLKDTSSGTIITEK